jgi:DNA polymerase
MTIEWSHDFETRSAVDLRTQGMYRYFDDDSTDALCLAWRASPDQPGGLWKRGEPPPAELCQHIESGGTLRGWNVGFERQCFEKIMGPRYGWPVPKLEQFVCTMMEAGAMALPRSLEKCAPVLGLTDRKDMDGSKAMKKLCKPRKVRNPGDPKYDEHFAAALFDDVKYTILGSSVIEWWADDALFAQLYPYCEQDVLVELRIASKVRRLPASERTLYLLDQRINDRGIRADLDLVAAMSSIADTVTEDLNKQFAKATNYEVTKATQASKLIQWLQARGVETDSVDKEHVRDLLLRDDLTDEVREVVKLREQAAISSNAKLDSLADVVCADGKLHGLLFFMGANTGRWSGRLFQPHNLPRGTIKKIEHWIDLILTRDAETISWLVGDPLKVVSSALRSVLTADHGKKLFVADYSNIEGRVNAWLAGEAWKVKAFEDFDNGIGADLYKLAYSKGFNVPIETIDDDMRQRGKVMELSMGYQGGVQAFHAMGKNYGLKLPDAEADRLKVAWRDAHPAIVQSWRDLEDGALQAVRQPGNVVSVLGGKIRYVVKGGYLWMILPSGRALCYSKPHIQVKEMPWKDRSGKPAVKDCVMFWSWNSDGKKGPVGWHPKSGYGGHWCENAVQAIARDLMCHGMLNVEAAGYEILLTVHDEVISERPDDGSGSVKGFEGLMSELPDWAAGCPVAAAGWGGHRYKKG